MIDGKPLWMFTKVMSVRDMRPAEVEYAPVAVMTLFWAVTNAYADGRRRAERDYAIGDTPAQAQARADAARQRQADRKAAAMADWAEMDDRGDGEEGGDG